MEHFDALGRYRDTDAGLPIVAEGTLASLGTFASPADLGAILHDSEQATACLVTSLWRDSVGHAPEEGEAAAVDALVERFVQSGHSYQTLMVELALSPAFSVVGPPK
jgi:hypothetical protein